MTNFMHFPGGRIRALTLSYDDGVEQDIHLMEILNNHGMKCTFNLNGYSYEEEERSFEPGQIHRRMARRQAIEAYNGELGQNHEIAIHGYSHPFLDKIAPEMASYEIVEDRRALEGIFGRIIKGCAYPFGTTNDKVVEILGNSGILYARTTVATRGFGIPTDWLRMPATCHHKDARLTELCDSFLADNDRYGNPKLFYLWGHSYEFDIDNNWNVIEEFAEKMGDRKDIWYATNMEIYLYVESYRALQFSADGNRVYNPSALTVWFRSGNVEVKVEPGEALKIR